MKIIRKNQNKDIIKVKQAGEVTYLAFPMLEEVDCIRHVFSTRIGGVSEGYVGTMNLSYSKENNRENVTENFSRIGTILGADIDQFVLSNQTHTTNVVRVYKEDAGKGITKPLEYSDVDGLVTNCKGIVLSTFYADCVPLFFVDPVKKAIGMSHSGWRGTVAQMGKVTVETMQREFGTNVEDLYVAIGPSICKECYEVSEDVANAFKLIYNTKEMTQKFGKNSIDEILSDKGNGKYQLDLWKANKFILQLAGVLPNKIQITDICTCCNPDLLFSHRASNGKRGNLGGFIMLK